MKSKAKFLLQFSTDIRSNMNLEESFILLETEDGVGMNINSIEELEALRDMLTQYIPLIKESLKTLKNEKK